MIEDGDAAELAHALGIAAKARSMSEVAKSTGISPFLKHGSIK
jgi:probable addiction module antidote protein